MKRILFALILILLFNVSINAANQQRGICEVADECVRLIIQGREWRDHWENEQKAPLNDPSSIYILTRDYIRRTMQLPDMRNNPSGYTRELHHLASAMEGEE